MLTMDALAQYGANIEEGVQRCFGNEEFYLKLVKMMPQDANMQRLLDAIDAGDLDTAFDAAHALKGATGNLSLMPLYDPLQEITELLRARKEMDYQPLAAEIKTHWDALMQLCAE